MRPSWVGPDARRDTFPITAASILAIVVLLRLVAIELVPPLPEEAYYWNYAQHLDIGYLDHPPLVAWLIAGGEMLVGYSDVGLRAGAFLCGLATLIFIYRLARNLVEVPSALMASALAATLPFFFGTGVMMTPDAPLMAAWSASLYYLHGALVLGRRAAWLGAGTAIGVGLLAKYTIALTGLAALVFVLLDRQARQWLKRFEPYAAAAIALMLFGPVIVWNYQHDWASFLFHARDRFDEPSFSLHALLTNVLVVATPLPPLALPFVFAKRWTSESQTGAEPEHASPRNRLFAACFVFVPLVVFVLNALRHEPRLNWTAPIWLMTLPMLGWTLTHVHAMPAWRWAAPIRHLGRPLVVALLMINATLLFHLSLGLPGVPYSKSLARFVGWRTATEHIQEVHDRLAQATGRAPVIIGMDKYFTASQVSYHAARIFDRRARQTPMTVTAMGVVFDRDALMFNYWHAPEQFTGDTFIMVARRRAALESENLADYFGRLGPHIHSLPIINDVPGSDGRLLDHYYYRIGYDYRPDNRRSDDAIAFKTAS